jgi:anti-sigma B factor antagonist
MEPFEISVTARDDTVRLRVLGEVDVTTAPKLLDSILCAAIAHGPCKVVVDLRDLTFIDSTGIHGLAMADRWLRAQRCHLIVVDPPEMVQRVFAITGVDDLLDVRLHAAAPALRPTEPA